MNPILLRVLVMLLCALPWVAPSQAGAGDSDPAGVEGQPPRIGLVLGGGGARGAAHIGVLRVLERERIPVDFIAGTSMGAIVGGLYATGFNADEIEAILGEIDWPLVFSDSASRDQLPMRRKDDSLRLLSTLEAGLRDGRLQLPRGVLQGQNLWLLLRRLTLSTWDIEHFDELPIPYRSVAADLGSGEAYVFERGDLATAIRASMSVPAAFQPVRHDGRLLVDGGIVDNVPIDVAREMGATQLIVVDVGEPLAEVDSLNSPVAVTMQMVSVLMKRQTELQIRSLGDGDVLIRPRLGDIGGADFDRGLQAVGAGVEAAEIQLEALRRLSVDETRWAEFRARHRPRAFDPPLVEFLAVRSDRSRSSRAVAAALKGIEGQPLDPIALERGLARAYGAGRHERIVWRLDEREGQRGIEVLPVDKGWGPNFVRLGFQLNDDFRGNESYQLDGELLLAPPGQRGDLLGLRARAGRSSGLGARYFLPFGQRETGFIEARADTVRVDQPLLVDGRPLSLLRLGRSLLAFEGGLDIDHNHRIALGVERGETDLKVRVGPTLPGLGDLEGAYSALLARYTHDTLDSASFPRRGQRLEFRGDLFRPVLGSRQSGQAAQLVYDRAWHSGA